MRIRSRSGRFPGEGTGNPLQYSCLENSMHRGAWQVTVHGVAKSQTWLKLSMLYMLYITCYIYVERRLCCTTLVALPPRGKPKLYIRSYLLSRLNFHFQKFISIYILLYIIGSLWKLPLRWKFLMFCICLIRYSLFLCKHSVKRIFKGEKSWSTGLDF